MARKPGRNGGHCTRCPVGAADAARGTAGNYRPEGVGFTKSRVTLWRRSPFVQANYPEPLLRRLESDLVDQAAAGGPAPITWDLRQVVLERA